jgi:hypothetical protein
VPFLLHAFYKHRYAFNFSYNSTETPLSVLYRSAAVQFAIQVAVHFICCVFEYLMKIPNILVWKTERRVCHIILLSSPPFPPPFPFYYLHHFLHILLFLSTCPPLFFPNPFLTPFLTSHLISHSSLTHLSLISHSSLTHLISHSSPSSSSSHLHLIFISSSSHLHLISHLISSHLISSHLISSHLISSHLQFPSLPPLTVLQVYLLWEIANFVQIITLIVYCFKTLPATFFCDSTDPCSCSRNSYFDLTLFFDASYCT